MIDLAAQDGREIVFREMLRLGGDARGRRGCMFDRLAVGGKGVESGRDGTEAGWGDGHRFAVVKV